MYDTEYTVEDFLAAIEKNGLEQTRNALYRDENGYISSRREAKKACAIGMGAYNLNLPGNVNFPCASEIVRMNDDMKLSFKEIAKKFREDYPEYLNEKIQALTNPKEL